VEVPSDNVMMCVWAYCIVFYYFRLARCSCGCYGDTWNRLLQSFH